MNAMKCHVCYADDAREVFELICNHHFTFCRPGVVPTKKTSSKPLQVIASGVREKLRRKSEDEDSGVGDTERFSPGVLAAGVI